MGLFSVGAARRGGFGGLHFRLSLGSFGGALLAAFTGTAVFAVRVDALKFGGIFFLFFEEIGDVQEGVPLQAHVDKRGLHAGEDPGDTALINRAG